MNAFLRPNQNIHSGLTLFSMGGACHQLRPTIIAAILIGTWIFEWNLDDNSYSGVVQVWIFFWPPKLSKNIPKLKYQITWSQKFFKSSSKFQSISSNSLKIFLTLIRTWLLFISFLIALIHLRWLVGKCTWLPCRSPGFNLLTGWSFFNFKNGK